MLDNQTTLILAGLICALLPLLLWWLAPTQVGGHGQLWWPLGSLVAAAGLILLSLRMWLPVWLGNHTANTALIIALVLWTQSLRTMLDQAWRLSHVGWICLLALVYYAATYAFMPVGVRISINRVVMGCLALGIAWLAWRLAKRDRSPNALGMSLCYAVLGGGLFVSAWLAFSTPLVFSPEGVLLKIPGSPAVLTMVTAVLGGFCYLGLLLEQSSRKKQQAMQQLAIADENARRDTQLHVVERQQRMVLAAGSLAHELNQPLTAALLRTELAQQVLDSPAGKEAEIAEILDKASSSLERTQKILSRIQDAAQSQQLTRSTLDMKSLVSVACELAAAELWQLGVRVQRVLPEEALLCRGDEVLLSQVLLNLLHNAAQAMSSSQVKLVEIRVEHVGSDVVLTVRDHGPGLPQDVLQRWGEPFQSTRPQGMGLGLAICRAIVQQHDGVLDLRNLPHGGAEAVLKLPALHASLT